MYMMSFVTSHVTQPYVYLYRELEFYINIFVQGQ